MSAQTLLAYLLFFLNGRQADTFRVLLVGHVPCRKLDNRAPFVRRGRISVLEIGIFHSYLCPAVCQLLGVFHKRGACGILLRALDDS